MMNEPVFRWTHHRYAVSADLVGKTVTAIAEEHGACRPEQLVSVAADKKSPLHPLFTWDNSRAADNWRAHEARSVIGSLATVTVREDGKKVVTPAFISVGHTKGNHAAGGGYRPVSVVMVNPDLEAEALSMALAQLQGLRRRYSSIQQLSPVWEALDSVTVPQEVAA